MKKIRIVAAIILIVLAAIFVLSGCSKKETTVSDIISVEVKGKGENREVKIEVSFTDDFVAEHKGQKLYLIAKDVSGENVSYTPVDDAKVKSEVKFEIPYETNGKDYKSTAFVCAIVEGEGDAAQFTPVTNEKYISNLSELGGGSSRPDVSSIKGLFTTDIGHAAYLGADHILLEVRIDGLLLPAYTEGSEPFVSQGQSYYFDGDRVEYYDKIISEATKMGARVYLQFVLGKPTADDEWESIEALYFGGVSSKSKYYMPNVSTPEGVNYMSALFGFFADRYSGGNYGSAVDYIIGKNVNSASYNDAGTDELASRHYLSLVRIAYGELVTRVSDGKVYISLDNSWRAESGGALAYINAFNNLARSTGNFEWNIAMSYGQLSSDTIWAVTDEYSTSFGAQTLGELSALLSTDDFKVGGGEREVIISEMALARKENSENNSTRRAASYVYAYYATQKYSCVKALIYSSYSDDKWGILTNSGESTSLCDAIEICGSNRVGELSYMDSLVGDKWTSIKAEGLGGTSIYYGGVTTSKVKTNTAKRLFNFSEGNLYGFEPMGAASFASLSQYTDADGNSGSYMLGDGTSEGWRVFASGTVSKSEINSSKHLGVTLDTEFAGEEFVIIITGISKKDKTPISYCAKAQVGDAAAEYFFDISDFADKLSSSDISFALCTPVPKGTDAGSVALFKVALYGSSGTQVWKYVIIALVIVLLAVALVVVVKIIDKTRKKKSKSNQFSKKKNSKKNNAPVEKIKGVEDIDDEDDE